MKYYTPTKLSENISETPEGFLLCVGVAIARTGEMLYGKGETPLETDNNGRVVISRDEKEVFKPETIASFEGKPVTISHPEEFVNPENWKELTVGIVQNVRRGEADQKDDLIADLLITDAIAIGLVKRGLREVSCGYEAEYSQTGEGTGIQSNIIGNHLALVEEGRAGSAYAINDNKNGKGVPVMAKKFSEKIKAMFAKVADEAEKMADEEMGTEKEDKKVDDAASYDELVKICKDLSAKVEALAKPKDAAPFEKKEEKKADDAEMEEGKKEKADDEEEVAPGLEDRLKALEAAVAKMMESESEEAGDDDMEEEMGDDAEGMEEAMVGDTAARAEILAPGIAHTKDIKAKALKQAYGTKDGKQIIHSLTGGKAPAFDSADKVNALFIAASELFRVTRTEALSRTKQTRAFDSQLGVKAGAMTPEEINQINEKHFGLKK